MVEVDHLEFNGKKISPNCRILLVAPGPPPVWNDQITATGALQKVPAPRNPTQFDARRAWGLQGITCELLVSSEADIDIDSPSGFSIPRFAAACRQWMESTLRLGIGDEPVTANLIAGLVLGITSDIPDELQDQFRQTGTFHLFSVSGLHVGMIAMIFWQLLRTLGAGRRTAVLLIIPSLFFYSLITGWKPSSVRAATMATIFLLGMLSSRQVIPLNSLCAAAFIILAQSTNELFNPGFQLSVTVVAAILLFSSPICSFIEQKLQPDPFIPVALWSRWQGWQSETGSCLGSLLGVSVGAWIGSLPLTLVYFHMVSLSALAVNPVVVPLAFVIMATALASLASGLIAAGLAAIFNNANLALANLLVFTIQSASQLPLSHVMVGLPEKAPAVVTVFDFANGGAAAIHSNGTRWLLDSGSAWNFKNTIAPWLRRTGAISPTGVVLSHGDSQHIGGVLEIISGGAFPQIFDSALKDRSPARARLHRELEQAGQAKSFIRSSDAIRLSPKSTLKILHPPTGIIAAKSDDKVVVSILETYGTKVLFLSDAGPATWRWLEQNNAEDMKANIVVAGRHFSGMAPDAAFLSKVNPDIVIATASAFPANEPIDSAWAAALRDLGIELFRQDETGAVQVSIFENGYKAEGFLNNQAITTRAP